MQGEFCISLWWEVIDFIDFQALTLFTRATHHIHRVPLQNSNCIHELTQDAVLAQLVFLHLL